LEREHLNLTKRRVDVTHAIHTRQPSIGAVILVPLPQNTSYA